jgi:pimeloyl-ACP methyl ester carboxylesterase
MPADDLRARYDELTTRWEFPAADGRLLRGRRADGRGATLHFLSGNGFCGGVYWPFLRRFLPARGLLVHDLEGQGESDAPPHYAGHRETLRRVRAVVDAQQLQRPLVGMGHSFGAALTLRCAAENPGLFRALVLLDPILFPPATWLGVRLLSLLHRHPFADAARRRRDRWPSRAAAMERLRGRGIYQGWSEESLASFAAHALADDGAEAVLRCPRELEAQIYERPVYPWPALRRVDCPILFLRGAGSYPFFAAAEGCARRANPRVQVEHLPGGHCFMQEDPVAAHAAVVRFLDAHGA